MVHTTYEGLYDEEELEMVNVISKNNNNYYNIVSDFKSDDETNTKLSNEKMMTKRKQSPRPLSMQKWYKPWQASYNKGDNKIVKEAAQ